MTVAASILLEWLVKAVHDLTVKAPVGNTEQSRPLNTPADGDTAAAEYTLGHVTNDIRIISLNRIVVFSGAEARQPDIQVRGQLTQLTDVGFIADQA